jgi:hypothetical protein
MTATVPLEAFFIKEGILTKEYPSRSKHQVNVMTDVS